MLRIHPTIHLTCGLQLLLRGQEGRRLEALDPLKYSKLPNSEAIVSTSTGPSHPLGITWSLHILQVGPVECILPRLDPGGRRAEDCLHHTMRSL